MMRYHTSSPSFNNISLPSIPVNPARKTEICNLMSACFMKIKETEYYLIRGLPDYGLTDLICIDT